MFSVINNIFMKDCGKRWLVHPNAGYFFDERQVVSDAGVAIGVPAGTPGRGSEADDSLLDPDPRSCVGLAPLEDRPGVPATPVQSKKNPS